MTYEEQRDSRLNSRGYPDWAKDVLRVADSKDVVDATNILEDIAYLFQQKCDQIANENEESTHTCSLACYAKYGTH